MTTVAIPELDIRALAAAERPAAALSRTRGLVPGDAFELVADADPAPLLAQLADALPGRVRWTHVVSGPQLWRVRVERAVHGERGACCGSCGGGA